MAHQQDAALFVLHDDAAAVHFSGYVPQENPPQSVAKTVKRPVQRCGDQVKHVTF
ncbi:MAG: hypothetical protein WA957_11040 [Alteraurantiacibacter sp.]